MNIPKPTKYQKTVLSLIVSTNKKKKSNKRSHYQQDSFDYWLKSIRRLNIFLGLSGKDKIPTGHVTNGRIDRETCLIVKIALKQFLAPYAGKAWDYRPFSEIQETQMMRTIAGKLFV